LWLRQRAAGCERNAARAAGVWSPERQAAVHAAFTATGKPYAEDAYRAVDRGLARFAESWRAMSLDSCRATRLRGTQSEDLFARRERCLERELGRARVLADLYAGADAQVVQNATAALKALSGVEGCADATALEAAVPPPPGAQALAAIAAVRVEIDRASALADTGKPSDARAAVAALPPRLVAVHYRPLQVEYELVAAKVADRLNDFAGSERGYLRAATEAEAIRDDADLALAWVMLGQTEATRMSRPDDGMRALDFAAAVLEARPQEALAARVAAARANVFLAQGDWAASERALLEAIPRLERTVGPEDNQYFAAVSNLGIAQMKLGRFEDALATSERARAISEKVFGPMHPDFANVLMNIGNVLHKMGREDEAAQAQQRALEIREQTVGPEDPVVASSLSNLAQIKQDAGRLEEARRLYERALAINEKSFGPEHASTAKVAFNLCLDLQELGDFARALPLCERALAAFEKASPNHPLLAPLLAGVASAKVGLGQGAAAAALLDRVDAFCAAKGHACDAGDLAHATFVRAQVVWQATRNGERTRALLAAAREALVAVGPRAAHDIAMLDAWRARQRGL
jgi:eukaryotic-like serine/threonine-protein kinase